MSADKKSLLRELAEACNNGACNTYALIIAFGQAIKEGWESDMLPRQAKDSVEIKVILGQLSYLVGESCGPSFDALEKFNETMSERVGV